MAGKKIKVLFRHRSMEIGGVEKVVLSMMNNLNREKFDLTVCLNINQGELRNDFPPHVKKVYIAEGREDMSKNPVLQKIQLLKRKYRLGLAEKNAEVAQNLLRENYDVEIATTYSVYKTVLNSTNKNSRKIAWLHSDLTLEGFDPYREEIFANMQQFDYIIYGSKQCKDALDEKFPQVQFPPGEVILNAIPISEIRSKANEFLPDQEDVPTFISVGRLHFRKGYKTLLEVHKKLLDSGYSHKIKIIGDGEDFDFLVKRIEELNVKKTFLLLGTKMNPYPYVKNSDFYVMPSESEGWPLIIAETLILKKPILATNVGGIPEMIDHNSTGYLVEYSEDGLYKGMVKFLTDGKLTEKIKHNLENIDEKFDNRKIFNAVEKIITDITCD
ncbi:glycosyl transferase family 1 [Chryseobacterium sp. Leaf404]|uniref:glycosyltransferase n=1 Tax=unclassified Chryseobacterium TaxID=2593645 RepID=UPI000701C3DC|nr:MULTISPECIES: glycosyltransferase [unclassified Chryseobacterium]KQT15527.1 glycosyl transferase family 1 [Chryseobacterium sp. Leaf404]